MSDVLKKKIVTVGDSEINVITALGGVEVPYVMFFKEYVPS